MFLSLREVSILISSAKSFVICVLHKQKSEEVSLDVRVASFFVRVTRGGYVTCLSLCP